MITNSGQHSLRKRMGQCNPQDLDADRRTFIERHILQLDVDRVQSSNSEVATFYAWVS